ncbi:MAG: phosphate ABC transporter permease subunit PstC [Oligoflexia bacterium]
MKGDRIFLRILRVLAGTSLVLLIAFLVMLLVQAWPALKHSGLSFFWRENWDPANEVFGAGAFVYGTVVSSVLGLLIALPVSVASALCLTELFSKRLAGVVSFLVEMLAAIPSVVFGLWGIFVLAPLFRSTLQPFLAEHLGFIPLFSGPPLGVGMLTASVVLAIMVTPTLTALSREVFKSIPRIQREAALALGATRWEMIRISVLASARSGLGAATILAWGRALGETMAVTMVIGNRPQIEASLFAPAQTLASVLANEYAEASEGLHLSALSAVGLALLLVSVVVHFLARIFIRSGTSGSAS